MREPTSFRDERTTVDAYLRREERSRVGDGIYAGLTLAAIRERAPSSAAR